MHTHSLMRTIGMAVVAVVAVGVLLVTPAVTEGPGGRASEPVGVAIDLVAVAVLVVIAWRLLRGRRGSPHRI